MVVNAGAQKSVFFSTKKKSAPTGIKKMSNMSNIYGDIVKFFGEPMGKCSTGNQVYSAVKLPMQRKGFNLSSTVYIRASSLSPQENSRPASIGVT